jgi:hypothetical protein
MSSMMCIEIESQIYIRIQRYIAKLDNGTEQTEQPQDVELVVDPSRMKYVSHVIDALHLCVPIGSDQTTKCRISREAGIKPMDK